jgi:hypothetical protein
MAVTDKVMLTGDRILEFVLKEGQTPASANGMLDKRLFTGENKLHVIKDPETCFWSFKYDSGAVPPVLHQNFTTFRAAFKHASDYYAKRNIELKEITY